MLNLLKRRPPKNVREIPRFNRKTDFSERDRPAVNLRTNPPIKWSIKIKNKLKNTARSSLSALTLQSLTMPTACAKTAITREAALSSQPNAATETVLFMPKECARTAILAFTTRTRGLSRRTRHQTTTTT